MRMRSLLDAGTLSKVLRVSPERIEELARTARLPFAFSAGQGILVDSRDVQSWQAAIARAGCCE